MARRYERPDRQWAAIPDLLPGQVGDRSRTAADNRAFVNGVLRVLRSGARWSDLPPRYGANWKSVPKRFTRWAHGGVWGRVFGRLSRVPHNDCRMIDSAIVRAHQSAASGKGGAGSGSGALPRRTDHQGSSSGRRSRPPVGPDHHAGPDTRPTAARALLEGQGARYVRADRAYDAARRRESIVASGAEPVIPPNPTRKHPASHDRIRDRDRNRIERLVSRLKRFRLIARRYDRRAASYLAAPASSQASNG